MRHPVPEGDTIHRAADVLDRALAGRAVMRLETSVAAVAAAAARAPVTGRLVARVAALGKHLLVVLRPAGTAAGATASRAGRESEIGARLGLFPGDLVLHTHMRMHGAWHLYRPGEPWRRPARQARVTLHTPDWVAPCFNAPVVELLSAAAAERHPALAGLGPDATAPGFDGAQARARLVQRPDLEIGVALLDQRLLAGVGNVFKSEVLFTQRVSPFARVGGLAGEVLDRLVAEAHRLLRQNAGGGWRRTRSGLDPRERLWVYGRCGAPCRVCGAPVAMRRQGADARATYYCPRCQSAG